MSEMDLLNPADKKNFALTTRVVERRCSVSWRIDNFSAFKFKDYGKIMSPAFHCFSSTWALHLYPYGEGNNYGYSHISLNRLSPCTNYQMVSFKCFFKNQDGRTFYGKESDGVFSFNNNSSEISCDVRIERLIENLLNDALTVCCELISYESEDGEIECLEKQTPGKRPTLWPVPKADEMLVSDMQALLGDQKNSDVTIQVGEEKFPAHKFLLAARSSVFAAMLEHDMKERRSNTITIVDLEVAVVHDMLQYIYCGNVSDISLDKVLGLYNAADKYALMELKKQCSEFLQQNLSVDNVCDVAILADAHNDGMLVDCVKVFARNNTSLLSTEKWKRLAKINPRLAYEITLVIASSR